MKLRFDESGDIEVFRKLASDLAGDPNVAGLMVLGCDANGWTPDVTDPALKQIPKPVFGGIFPQIIYERKNRERGVLLVGLPVPPEIVIVENLSKPDADYATVLQPHARRWANQTDGDDDTLVVLVDGLSKRIAALVEALFFCFGLEHNCLGGGAGSLSFEQKPCLLTPTGLVADAGIVARLPMRSGIGVAHGWQPISESMKVTAADRNTILSLDWRPAFEVYRELVEAHSGKTFTDSNFFDIAKGYPFGINKLGSEVVVRDPLMVDDHNGLVCVGEVPTGAFVRLLNGSPESLIAAAASARDRARQSAPETNPEQQTALFMDCISRVLFLGDRMVDELNTAAGEYSLFGALTLGEIANNGRDYLEFYNKTSVLGLMCEGPVISP